MEQKYQMSDADRHAVEEMLKGTTRSMVNKAIYNTHSDVMTAAERGDGQAFVEQTVRLAGLFVEKHELSKGGQ